MSIKKSLYEQCQLYVQQRIDTARQAMEAAQEAANSESKSSAGDKYETGRAMAQLERDRNAQLLAEARKLDGDLKHVNIEKTFETVQLGSLVTTSRGTFFISIGAGKFTLDGIHYFAVSPASPIAMGLAGRKVGDVVTVNSAAYQVLAVM
ncbi:3-oxoacyl-ACP synthase [Spirosoma areae]